MSEEDIQPTKEDEIYCSNCTILVKRKVVACLNCRVQIKELKVSDKIISPVEKNIMKKTKSKSPKGALKVGAIIFS